MKDDWEDIDVSRKSNDKVYFESTLLQNISDSISFLKDEADVLLREIDSSDLKGQFDEIELEQFGQDAIDQIDDIVCDMSQMKDEIIESSDVPEFIRDSSIDAKRALNRDIDYVRRAQRRFDRIESGDSSIYTQKSNIRVVELCDKAIDVNETNVGAYMLKGKALTNLEMYDDAIDEFINTLALDEDNLDAKIAIGDANRLNGDLEDAIDIYNSVIAVDDKSFAALRGKALAYYGLEKFSDADAFFHKANSIQSLDDDDKKIWDMCN